jgi:competence protein ComEA
MFARHTTSDTDAVAAARRRLAALAAEFASAEAARAGTLGSGLSPPLRSQRDDGEAARGSGYPPQQLLAEDPPGVDGGASTESSGPGRSGVLSASTETAGRHRERAVGNTPLVRWRLTAHHLLVAALVVIALLVVAAWWIVRAMPHAEPVELSSSRELPPGAVTTTLPGTPPVTTSGGIPGATEPSPGGSLVVDVTGRVRRPGIVELPAGARVIDAIEDAGGVRPGVDTSGLNLARLLVDGEQVVVGQAVPAIAPPPGSLPTGSAPTGSEIAPINLNTATQPELETLPGIGPVTAQSILAWRTDNGAFTAVEELLEVSGVGDVTLADIAPYVYV